MKTWFFVVIIIFGLLAMPFLIGSFLPQKHSASLERQINIDPEKVYERITTVKAWPEWQTDIGSVEIISQSSFKVSQRGDIIEYAIVAAEPPNKFATQIISKDLPYGGSWTIEIAPAENGSSMVKITENGEVYSPLFRFFSKFIFGHTKTIDSFLNALEASFNTRN